MHLISIFFSYFNYRCLYHIYVHYDSVNNLALIIEHRFLDNQFVTPVDEQTFAWFKNSKFGTSNMLTVTIQIKDQNGSPIKRKLPPLTLTTSLVYEDDSPAPLVPLCPLRDSQKKNPKYILTKMFGEPRFSSNNVPVEFSFRIEEVIFHHSGHKGFKLNVVSRAKNDNSFRIHQCPMEEVIVVLSKPKMCQTPVNYVESSEKAKMDTRSRKRKRDVIDDNDDDDDDDAIDIFDETALDEEDFTSDNFFDIVPADQDTKSARSEDSSDEIKKKEEDRLVVIPIGAIIDSYRCLDACFCCKVPIARDFFLFSNKHTMKCVFANEVLPLLILMGIPESYNAAMESNHDNQSNRGDEQTGFPISDRSGAATNTIDKRPANYAIDKGDFNPEKPETQVRVKVSESPDSQLPAGLYAPNPRPPETQVRVKVSESPVDQLPVNLYAPKPRPLETQVKVKVSESPASQLYSPNPRSHARPVRVKVSESPASQLAIGLYAPIPRSHERPVRVKVSESPASQLLTGSYAHTTSRTTFQQPPAIHKTVTLSESFSIDETPNKVAPRTGNNNNHTYPKIDDIAMTPLQSDNSARGYFANSALTPVQSYGRFNNNPNPPSYTSVGYYNNSALTPVQSFSRGNNYHHQVLYPEHQVWNNAYMEQSTNQASDMELNRTTETSTSMKSKKTNSKTSNRVHEEELRISPIPYDHHVQTNEVPAPSDDFDMETFFEEL